MVGLKGLATVRAGRGRSSCVVVAVVLTGHRIQELLGADNAIVAICRLGIVVVQGAFRLAVGLATMTAGKEMALWLELRAAISIVPAIHMTQTRLTRLAAAKVAKTPGDTVP